MPSAAPTERVRRLTGAELADVVQSAARGIAVARGAIDLAAGSRRYCRVGDFPTHDIWVIVWGAASGVEWHDHGGSDGAFAVVRGVLAETTLTDAGPAVATFDAGAVRQLDRSVVHEVTNAGTAPAVSVHSYSPPLRAMGFYEESGTRVRTDPVT